IGLNFDRQWEGTMSDINFDPRFSRNIMVDTKYILFIVDKYADAKWLLNEMKIVK
ncbi:MAG: S46 family peptidase, partial [Kaistella sp.]